MTKEEAIYELKNAAWLGTDHSRARTEEAVQMAIKALENHDTFMKYAYSYGKADALSQEPCDDAISREAVKEMICAEFVNPQDGMQEWRNAVNDTVENVLHKVEQLPSVTQKSGKWIETEYHRWRCSVCREKGMSEWDNIHDVRTNFCPDCGARMESEEV